MIFPVLKGHCKEKKKKKKVSNFAISTIRNKIRGKCEKVIEPKTTWDSTGICCLYRTHWTWKDTFFFTYPLSMTCIFGTAKKHLSINSSNILQLDCTHSATAQLRHKKFRYALQSPDFKNWTYQVLHGGMKIYQIFK